MRSDNDLDALMARLRDREPGAVDELVRRYEPDIRRIARVRLSRFRLRHLIDSEDIAQSVFGRFITRLNAGGLEFESADKLLRMLAVIASNRVTSHARRERRRSHPDGKGIDHPTDPFVVLADPQPGPGQAVAAREELDWLLNSLSPEERSLLDDRLAGKQWAEIATDRGVGADALRKRLTRALDEAANRLGLSGRG